MDNAAIIVGVTILTLAVLGGIVKSYLLIAK
jgi:hypothetical protein